MRRAQQGRDHNSAAFRLRSADERQIHATPPMAIRMPRPARHRPAISRRPTSVSPRTRFAIFRTRHRPARAAICARFQSRPRTTTRYRGRRRDMAAPTSAITVAPAATMVRHCPRCEQRERDQQAELRLVGEQAEQDAGEQRPLRQYQQRRPQQSRGEKTVLTVTEIDENGGERGGRRQPDLGDGAAVLPRLPQDGGDDGQIKREGRALPHRQRQRIGQHCQRRRDKQKDRRIQPAVIGRGGAEDLLLAGVMRGHVVDVAGAAFENQRTGGIKAGKIGADRLAVAIDAGRPTARSSR